MRQLLTDLRGNPIHFSSRRRQRRYRHPNLPLLFYRVQNRAWDDVVRRARSHPHEVTIQEDGTGNTPLHIACRLDPPSEVVRALLESSRTTNTEGATALHIAATHRCSADVIRVLLEDEDATSCLTRMGRAPIHYACMTHRGLGVEAFRLLLVETLQKGNVVMNESSVNEFDLIDEEDIAKEEEATKDRQSNTVNVMTMRDCTGQTPLGLLFRRYRERVRKIIKTVEKLRTEHEGSMASIAAAITVQAELGELWEKARIIVGRLTEERLQREGIMGDEELAMVHSPGEQAVAQGAAAWAAERHRRSRQTSHSTEITPVEERQFRIVHASVGLTGYGCPPELVRLAISLHPSQVQEMDEDGNLPLHIAATASSYTTSSNTGEANVPSWPGDEEASVSDLSIISSATAVTANAFDKVIRILLGHYPAAARIPNGRTGRLPFVMAIEGRRRTWDDGIKTLLDAFPAALESRRIPMAVYPYILSLISNQDTVIEGFLKKGSVISGKQRRQGLTTLFELVKAKPDLVRVGRRVAQGTQVTQS